MKKSVTTITLAFILTTAFGQLSSFFVQPHIIDNNYSVSDDSNYVALNTSVPTNNKLLVFLPGTGAKTRHYLLFPNLAANLGYHSIGLAYPNDYPTLASICAGNIDTNCYYNYRQEVCYGNNVSANASVDTLNCIKTRLVKMLQYLNTTYPSQGWGQFLIGNEPDWTKIAISGHSQGGGHALYIAKTNTCERMIMISGADDYSTYYNHPANWISNLPSQTPIDRFYSFLHLYDDVWDYSKQYAVIQSLGMTAGTDDSTLVDNKIPPYLNSHCLYTAVPPNYPGIYSAEHNGPVVDFYTPMVSGVPLYNPVWTYMLTATSTTSITDDTTIKNTVQIYPNPSNDKITIDLSSIYNSIQITIFNTMGQLLYNSQFNNTSQINLNVSNLSNGLYYINIQLDDNKIITQKIIINGYR